ncbi:helix-turn-helix domain-containing protein [Vagococcus sp. WN89Y]|uniref:helix-turn-helix domain-containing protein n=1 Tax=Vagococcus sp. WN89Y TaxID=3457258 RepID=UPI003FCDB255
MERNINIILYKTTCPYTKKGISELGEEISKINGQHTTVNFITPCRIKHFSHAVLAVTKGNFIPFTLYDSEVIVIPDKVSVDVLLDIFIEYTHGRLSHYVKTITLGKREISVLQEILFEKSDSEISDLLNINIKTVSSHKDNIKKKISATSKIDVFYAFSIFTTKELALAAIAKKTLYFNDCIIPGNKRNASCCLQL